MAASLPFSPALSDTGFARNALNRGTLVVSGRSHYADLVAPKLPVARRGVSSSRVDPRAEVVQRATKGRSPLFRHLGGPVLVLLGLCVLPLAIDGEGFSLVQTVVFWFFAFLIFATGLGVMAPLRLAPVGEVGGCSVGRRAHQLSTLDRV